MRDMQRAVCQRIFADDMAHISFAKWQGTGNDFIVVDDRSGRFPAADPALVRHLCDRHFGIGSDGLILVRMPQAAGTAYHMEFFNPDGSRSFCGNGSRCAYAFYSALLPQGKPPDQLKFTAIDGEHTASAVQDQVNIGMRDVTGIERLSADMDLIHTGSPHLLVWVDDPEGLDILPAAHVHRYSDRFKREGVNVNFVRWKNGQLEMRTYERGVENETLSCGTGVTAAALGAMARGLVRRSCPVRTRGGELRVDAEPWGEGFRAIILAGPATHVFNGEVEI